MLVVRLVFKGIHEIHPTRLMCKSLTYRKHKTLLTAHNFDIIVSLVDTLPVRRMGRVLVSFAFPLRDINYSSALFIYLLHYIIFFFFYLHVYITYDILAKELVQEIFSFMRNENEDLLFKFYEIIAENTINHFVQFSLKKLFTLDDLFMEILFNCSKRGKFPFPQIF